MMARKLLTTAIMQAADTGPPPAPPVAITPAGYINNFGEFDAPQDIPFGVSINFGDAPHSIVWSFTNVNTGGSYVAPTIQSGQGTTNVTVRFNGNTDATLVCTVTDNNSDVEAANANLLVHFGVVP